MKSFKEYLEEQEEQDFILNENVSAEVFGEAGMYSLAILGAGVLLNKIIKNSKSSLSKTKKNLKIWLIGLKGKSKEKVDIETSFDRIKENPMVRQEVNKQNLLIDKYEPILSEVYKKIDLKDATGTIEELKKVSIKKTNTDLNKVIVLKSTESFGEPPLHFGNTGNETYLFIKRVLGIKVARAAAEVIKVSMKKFSSEMLDDIE